MTTAHGIHGLTVLTVVVPARNEEGCIAPTVELLNKELRRHAIPHEIIVVDDGSTDRTWQILETLRARIPELRPVRNPGPKGFGCAVIFGLDRMSGDAAVIFMADGSDDCRDIEHYWRELVKGYDCVFGSRFIRGGGTTGYPLLKLILNRLANTAIRLFFRIGFNDTTNAFKAYRRNVIEGCRPFLSSDFSLTVELPLKAIIRGYRWNVVPITWRNRRSGAAKFKIREMGSRYFMICLHIWLERFNVGKRENNAERLN